MDFSFNFGEEKQNEIDESILEKPKKIEFKQNNKLKSKKFLQVKNFSFSQIILNEKDVDDEKTKEMMKKTDKTDLIPNVYEGGFKIWECSVDIIQYLEEIKFELKNKHVIDLGCGHGFPGIYSIKKGSFVTFQDYNDTVIENVTIPNFQINCNEDEIKNATFYSGDWRLLSNYIEEKYDVILTTDTLYSVDSHEILLDFIVKRLKKDGVCFIAAKNYYFGVGGGVLSFLNIVEEKSELKYERLKKISDGKSNIREILKLNF
eukprot:gene12012-5412_t